MTENEARTIRVMEHCILNEEFCDNCENRAQDYSGCRKTNEGFIEMTKGAISMRDALLADLHAVCAGKFVDICCICGHYQPQHPTDKCELRGLVCKWAWRGIQHENNHSENQG